MTQLSDDCFAFGGPLMTMANALALLHERTAVVAETETVALSEAASRVLAEAVTAAVDVPAHDNAAVDGYALRAADLSASGETRLAVTDRIAAGHPSNRPLASGTAARIFTGAAMPAGADTVVMQEDVRLDGDSVIVPAGLKLGANRRRAGEDSPAGDLVLQPGTRLLPQHLALAASVGRGRLTVYKPLRVALFSTGDELVEPGTPLPPGGVYDSNRYLLRALLAPLPVIVTDLGVLPDEPATVARAIADAAGAHDLLITSGGVSTGEEDHVRAAVEANGRIDFWRLAIKPGRPIALGQVAGAAFIGLPGNPVAVMVCFLRFARPLLLRLAGAAREEPPTVRVAAGFSHKKKAERREWLRARLHRGLDGSLRADKFPRQGSGLISSLVQSDGLVEIPEDVTHVAEGSMVDFLPFSEVMW